MQARFNAWKAPRAFSDSDTCSDFLLAPSPAMFVQLLGNPWKAFYEPPIMAHEAKEGSNLSVSLWWCTLGDGLQICIARPNTSFRYLMGQIVYLFFEETTL